MWCGNVVFLSQSAGATKDAKSKKGKKGKQQELKKQAQRQTKQQPQDKHEDRQAFHITNEKRDVDGRQSECGQKSEMAGSGTESVSMWLFMKGFPSKL